MIPSRVETDFLKLRVELWGLVASCGAILAVATVFGFLGSFSWFLDLFSHFRVQLFLGLAVVTLILLFRRRYKAPLIFGMFAVVNLCTIAPLYFGAEPNPAEASRSYRALLMNVNTATGVPAKVAEAIKELNPDALLLEEVNDQWLSALSVVLEEFPYSTIMPREDNFGIALYSKHPFVHSEIREIGGSDVPSVIAEVELPDGLLTIIGTHPLPPSTVEHSRLRNEQLAQLPGFVKQAKSPVLLLGDLNATPWCFPFKQLLKESGLRDSGQGRGVLGTWPTFLPILSIPIDHCLYSKGIHVTSREIGPNVGSDHYPLVVDFVLVPSPRRSGLLNQVRFEPDCFAPDISI